MSALSQSFKVNSKRRRADSLKPPANGRNFGLMCKSIPYFSQHLLFRSTLIVIRLQLYE